MARIYDNSFLMGISGMIGKQVVIKRRKNKPYIAAAPEWNPNRVPTPAQKKWDQKFKLNAAKAKALALHPDTRPLYLAAAKPGQTAYNLAFKDACKPPHITGISHQGYSGKTGDKIFIQAKDDFKVVNVNICIYNAAENLLEEGDALYDGIIWMYAAKTNVNNILGFAIVAKAYDIPGNEGVLKVILD